MRMKCILEFVPAMSANRFRRLRDRIVAILIVNAVPFLNGLRLHDSSWHKPVKELASYHDDTWGKQVVNFLDRHRFHEFLPKYEVHDSMHVLLSYEVSAVDELRLQAFMIGNRGASVPGKILVVLGLMILPETLPTLIEAYRRGRHSPQIRDWPVEDLLGQRLIELQSKLAPLL